MKAFAPHLILRCIASLAQLIVVATVGMAAEPKRDPGRTFWKDEKGGTFAQSADGGWMQEAASGNRFQFVTVKLQKDYVELLDESRNIAIRLYADKSEIRVGDGEFQAFLKGRWEQSAEVPLSGRSSVDKSSPRAADHRVRLIYFVPKDRRPIDKYQEKIRTVMGIADKIYRSEFRRRGWKSEGLPFEIDASKKPLVHLVHGKENASYYNGAPNYDTNQQWKTFIPEIPREIGVPSQHLIVGFLETYDEGPAPFEWPGGVALGAPFSADGGLGIFSAWILKDEFAASNEASQLGLLQDQTPILGRVARGHGRVNSPRFEFIEDGIGAVVHEIGHALGLPHDHRDPSSIMGNGFRRLRNNFVPSFGIQGQATFSDECAILLRSSRFLNSALDLTDALPPEASVKVQGAGSGPVSLKIEAADERGLRAIVVFDVIEDSIVTGQQISGKKWSKTVRVPLKRSAEGDVTLRVVVADAGGHQTVVRYP